MNQVDYTAKTKELIDYIMGKVPQASKDSFRVEVSWVLLESQDDENKDFAIAPVVVIDFDKG